MTVLVTGGCGFIGSHLVDALLKAGHTVRVVDDLSTGTREAIAPSVEVVVADVADESTFAPLLDDVDAVFHLAAIASVEASQKAWFRSHQVNSGGLVNLLQHIKQSGRVIPVVYASSAAVYGDCHASPIDESVVPAPLSAYGADKLACEFHGRIASRLNGIPALGLRFFNVFGPGQNPASPYSGVISLFMDKAARGESLTILGDGAQTRDFVFVGDVVHAMLDGLDALQRGQLGGEVFNVGGGHAITIRQLAQTICDIYGLDAKKQIAYGPAREGEIRHSLSDISRLKAALNWQPKWSLADGLNAIRHNEAA